MYVRNSVMYAARNVLVALVGDLTVVEEHLGGEPDVRLW